MSIIQNLSNGLINSKSDESDDDIHDVQNNSRKNKSIIWDFAKKETETINGKHINFILCQFTGCDYKIRFSGSTFNFKMHLRKNNISSLNKTNSTFRQVFFRTLILEVNTNYLVEKQ